MHTDKNIVDWYIQNKPVYKRLANKIESLLIEVFDMENISYHIVTSRAKDINSVKTKASKYSDPINKIQDFAGIRVITYVEDEVERVCSIIENIFDIDTDNSSNKSYDLGIDKVGYKSVHYIASLKNDRLKLPEYKQYFKKYFEIQVRTILQHAWAEIEHDRNYKFSGRLPNNINRRFKILSGMLEMADREFNNISCEIDLISSDIKEAVKSGELDIPISSTTLVQFLNSRLNLNGNIISSNDSYIIIDELYRYGIKSLSDLNKIIPEDIDKLLDIKNNRNINETGLARTLMILDNYDKYFSKVNIIKFAIWTDKDDKNDNFIREYFKKHGVDWNKIEDKYYVRYTA